MRNQGGYSLFLFLIYLTFSMAGSVTLAVDDPNRPCPLFPNGSAPSPIGFTTTLGKASAAEINGQPFVRVPFKVALDDNDEGLDGVPSSPPGFVDDTGMPDPGAMETNFTFDCDFSKGAHSCELPLLDLNVGFKIFKLPVQGKFEVPLVSQKGAGDEYHSAGTQTGIGRFVMGLKIPIYGIESENDGGEKAPEPAFHLSIYPQIESVTPGTHSDEKGLVDAGTAGILRVIFVKEFSTKVTGPMAVSANFGYVKPFNSSPDEFLGGLAVGKQVNKKTVVQGEIYISGDARTQERPLIILNGGIK